MIFYLSNTFLTGAWLAGRLNGFLAGGGAGFEFGRWWRLERASFNELNASIGSRGMDLAHLLYKNINE